jgi:glycosyltransferase involved in cell wall biosynthesis
MWQRLDALRRLGDVRLLPLFPSPHACLAPPRGVELEMTGSEHRSKRDLFRYPARIRELAGRYVGQAGRGIIWANSNLFTRRAAFAAARVTGWPVVIDVWDVPDLPMWSQYREGRYAKSLVHWAMSHRLTGHLESADLVVWSLHPTSARRYFRAEPYKTLFLPNGIRWGQLAPYREAIRHPRPADRNRPAGLLYMGHFRRSRGSRVLVEILSRLQDRVPVELHVVGDVSTGASRRAVEAIPEELRPSVRLHGHLPWPEAMALLSDCSICLYPFPHGPELEYIYPLKLLEYAALDKWIISSDLAGARQLLQGYRRVRFCDPARPEKWAEALCQLIEMPSEAAELPSEGFSVTDYDWEKLKRQLVGRARQILRNGHSRQVDK